jgi:dienelactone hydrolase
MGRTSRLAFLALVVAQSAHSIEEYRTRLYDVFPPARFASGLVSDDRRIGFAIFNAALVAVGLWSFFVPVRRAWPSARAFAWAWAVLEAGNGIGHIAWALAASAYRPGLATAPFLLGIALMLAALLWRDGRRDRAVARRVAAVAFLAAGLLSTVAAAQEHVDFPTEDDGTIFGDLYGKGERGVVLAHGGRFDKGSWESQARAIADAGYRVLAIDFRGYGRSRGRGQTDPLSAPLELDVLAAVRYLKKTGAKTVSVVGGSMGGGAAADASIRAPGEIDRLVLLAAMGSGPPEKLGGRKLFLVCRDDRNADGTPRLTGIRAQYERAPERKELVVLECSAHAQFVFQTEQGERVLREILRFLSAP